MSAPEIGQDLLITKNRFEANDSLRSVEHMLSSIFFLLTCDKFANSVFLSFTWYSQQGDTMSASKDTLFYKYKAKT